jgi:hypothetical protein
MYMRSINDDIIEHHTKSRNVHMKYVKNVPLHTMHITLKAEREYLIKHSCVNICHQITWI